MSLYQQQSNAVLTFSTGEVVHCCLKLQSTSIADIQAGGLQNRETRYKGNVTNSGTSPKYLLPPTITQNSRGSIIFDDKQSGEFIMFECLRTRWKSVEQMMGQNIAITFFPNKTQRSEQWN
jgi:hypothetical protein